MASVGTSYDQFAMSARWWFVTSDRAMLTITVYEEHRLSCHARPSNQTIRASRCCESCLLARGRNSINVSNSRIEVLACDRVARVLQQAADSGLPTGRFFVLVSTHSSFLSFSLPLILSSPSRPRPLILLLFRRKARPRYRIPSRNRPKLEKRARAQTSAVRTCKLQFQPCVHMVGPPLSARYFSPPSRKQTHCACFRVQSTRLLFFFFFLPIACCCFPKKQTIVQRSSKRILTGLQLKHSSLSRKYPSANLNFNHRLFSESRVEFHNKNIGNSRHSTLSAYPRSFKLQYYFFY